MRTRIWWTTLLAAAALPAAILAQPETPPPTGAQAQATDPLVCRPGCTYLGEIEGRPFCLCLETDVTTGQFPPPPVREGGIEALTNRLAAVGAGMGGLAYSAPGSVGLTPVPDPYPWPYPRPYPWPYPWPPQPGPWPWPQPGPFPPGPGPDPAPWQNQAIANQVLQLLERSYQQGFEAGRQGGAPADQ